MPKQYETLDSGKREAFETGCQRDTREGKGRYDLLPPILVKRLAELLERGAAKYGERNWEKGMPTSRCFDSALRHLFQALEGEPTEDHLAAVVFNVAAVMHYREQIRLGKLPASLDDVVSKPVAGTVECGTLLGYPIYFKPSEEQPTVESVAAWLETVLPSIPGSRLWPSELHAMWEAAKGTSLSGNKLVRACKLAGVAYFDGAYIPQETVQE